LESQRRTESAARIHLADDSSPPVAAGAAPAQIFSGAQHPRRQGRRLAECRRPRDGRQRMERRLLRSIGMMLSGDAIEEVDERGELITGDTLLILLNAHSDAVPFTLPAIDAQQRWERLVDTA